MDTKRTRKEVVEMHDAFAKRRQMFMDGLDDIMVDVSGLGMTSSEFSQKLLEEKYVATVPAIGLGETTGKYVRISYATSDENIEEGLRRIKEMVSELKK